MTAAPPERTTTALLERAAALHGDRPAIAFLPRGLPEDAPEVLTHAGLLDAVLRCAAALEGMGVRRGEGVALLLPPRPETFVALLGAQVAGHAVPLNPLLSPDHLEGLLRAAGATALVALGPDPAFPGIWPTALALRARIPGLKLACLGEAAEAPSLAALLAGADPGQARHRPEPGDLAACFHTGGTTGAPKLVRHTHANQAHAAWFFGRGYGIGPGDVVVNGFPLFHVAGTICHGLTELAAGAAILIPSQTGMRNQGFVRRHWQVVERHGVTILTAGPTFMTTLLDQPPDGAGTGRARVLITGGSPLPPVLADAFEARFGVPVRAVFGMTEAAGVVSLEPLEAPRVPLSCGFALPGSEVRAFPLGADGRADAAAGPLPAGAAGVLAMRGPQVSPGYTDPGAGEWLEGGWLVTGDLGQLDAAGRLFVTGRAKDVIIRSGHNLDPAAIEEPFLAHPAVAFCAAVGLPDAYAGELPMVFVQLRPGAATSAEALLAEVAPRIPEPAAVPKRVELVDALPLGATTKVFKPELRRRAAEIALRAAAGPGAEVAAVLTPQGVAAEVRLPPGADPALRERLLRFRLPVALREAAPA